MRLALSCAASSHDGPYIDDLVSLGNIIAIEGVGTLIKISAVYLQAITELRGLFSVLPSQSAILRPLNSYLQPRHSLYFVSCFGNRFGAVIGSNNVRVMLTVDSGQDGQRWLPVVVSPHVTVSSANYEIFSIHEHIGAGFQFGQAALVVDVVRSRGASRDDVHR